MQIIRTLGRLVWLGGKLWLPTADRVSKPMFPIVFSSNPSIFKVKFSVFTSVSPILFRLPARKCWSVGSGDW